ncbi:Os11g0115532 [Oryza sativa Japonica Group]|uniref:Os11g0115532 protein n=1 Tax=Oryza sativa subsp. japonica TaxID=39947 RepID=C7J8G7_ORYSJ|nr:Os11g0115532 [Oryza sativa Japonica Group]|eukprot:NP_001176317.1 Os11g0115532 [Oryza sativa Japonica Group]
MHFIEHLAITLSPPLEITIVRLPGRSWRLEGVEEEPCCRRRHGGSQVAAGHQETPSSTLHRRCLPLSCTASSSTSPRFAISPSREIVYRLVVRQRMQLPGGEG